MEDMSDGDREYRDKPFSGISAEAADVACSRAEVASWGKPVNRMEADNGRGMEGLAGVGESGMGSDGAGDAGILAE